MAQSRYATVAVRSRATFPWTGQFDGEIFEWGANAILSLTVDAARHCIRGSRVKWDPFMQRDVYVLHEVVPGQEFPEDLSWDDCHPTELLERSGMPATAFDDDGNPMPQKMRTLKLGTPTGMMRGRVPIGGNIAPDGTAFGGDHGLGASAPMDAEMKARFDEAHEKFADGVAKAQDDEERAGGGAPA